MRSVEFTGSRPLFPPSLDEPSVLRELDHSGVRVAAMSFGDEDVAVCSDDDVGGPVERAGAITGHAGLAQGQKNLAVWTELEHLMPFVGCSIRSVRCVR